MHSGQRKVELAKRADARRHAAAAIMMDDRWGEGQWGDGLRTTKRSAGLQKGKDGAPGGIRTHDPCLRSPKSRHLESIR